MMYTALIACLYSDRRVDFERVHFFAHVNKFSTTYPLCNELYTVQIERAQTRPAHLVWFVYLARLCCFTLFSLFCYA